MCLEPVRDDWLSRKIWWDTLEGYARALWTLPVRRSHWHTGEEKNIRLSHLKGRVSEWGRGWKTEAGRAAATADPVGDVTSKSGYVTADFKASGVANKETGNYGLEWEQRKIGGTGTWFWCVKYTCYFY